MIDAADFVIIATGDRALNDRLEARANISGVYCNRGDGISSFLIPSVVERRNFIVAISTLGRSPAMSRFLKEFVGEQLGPELSSMIDLQEELRDKARSIIPDQADRERFLWDILGDEMIWEELRHNPKKARENGADQDGGVQCTRYLAHTSHIRAQDWTRWKHLEARNPDRCCRS